MTRTRSSLISKLAFFVVVACGAVGLCVSRGSANAPAGRFIVGTGAQAGTVSDTATGLNWVRAPAETAMSWADASTYCADLVFAGASDWRLPTHKELSTLVDETRKSPAADPDAFPAMAASSFWSSTSIPWDSTQAVTVEFDLGSVGPFAKMYVSRVLCVR